MRKPVRQLLALLLLLLFAEKAGVRLWLHDYLHVNAASQRFLEDGTGAPKIQSISCDCLDDFSMPMTEAEAAILPQPVIRQHVVFKVQYNSPLFAVQIYSGLLRAPPAFPA